MNREMMRGKIQKLIDSYAASKGMHVLKLSDKKIAVDLSCWSCCYSRTKQCPIDGNVKDSAPCGPEGRSDYCPAILDAMGNTESLNAIFDSGDEIYIERKACGHYSCNGQHRICVAKRVGIRIPIPEENITSSPYECPYCMGHSGFRLI